MLGATRDAYLVAIDLVSHGTSGMATGARVSWAAQRLFPAGADGGAT